MELNTNIPESGNDRENKNRPETISELARRHLKDKSHKTTEEELRNATLELPAVADNTNETVDEADNEINKDISVSEDNNVDKEKSKAEPNPYDVLSS